MNTQINKWDTEALQKKAQKDAENGDIKSEKNLLKVLED